MRRLMFCVAVLVASALGCAPNISKVPTTRDVPPEVQRAVEEALQLTPDQEVCVPDLKEFEICGQSALGTPFQQFTITPQDLLSYDGEQPVQEIVSGRDQWFYPLFVDGQLHYLLEVALMGETWEVVGGGSRGLGLWWEEVTARYPTSAGYSHTFITIVQATADLILLERDGEAKLLSFHEPEPVEPSEILFPLKRTVPTTGW